MNFIKRLFTRKTTNSLNGSGYRFMMGGSTSGKHVNERNCKLFGTLS